MTAAQPIATNGHAPELSSSQEKGQKSQKIRPIGRPTLLDDGRVAALTSALEVGMTIKEAAHTAGVSVSTLKNWRREYPDLDEAINRAIAQSRLTAFQTLHKASADGDVQAAKALLDRTDPDRIEQRALTIQRQRQQIAHADAEEKRQKEVHSVKQFAAQQEAVLNRARFKVQVEQADMDSVAEEAFREGLLAIFLSNRASVAEDVPSHLRGKFVVSLDDVLGLDLFSTEEKEEIIEQVKETAKEESHVVVQNVGWGLPDLVIVDRTKKVNES